MYPMGGMNVGGMNVGGFPVGGMNVGGMNRMMYGGAAKGQILTDAEKAQMKALSAATRERNALVNAQRASRRSDAIELGIQDLKRLNPTLILPESAWRAWSTAAFAARVKASKPTGPAGGPRKGKGQFITIDGRRIKNPNYEAPTGLSFQRSRLTAANMKKKGTTAAQLAGLDAALTQAGFGIYDLESGEIMDGGAWYDDLWSGIKDVASTVAPVLPFIM